MNVEKSNNSPINNSPRGIFCRRNGSKKKKKKENNEKVKTYFTLSLELNIELRSHAYMT